MASMLFATSCSQDEVLNEPTTGEFVNAQFTVSTSEGIGTRAVGDGTTVNYVACAVYDANDNELPDLRQYVGISGKQATYSIRLVKGQKYRVAFFAYKGAADGTSTYYNMSDLKNIQILDASSNVEARDAFTNYVDVTAAETMAGAVQKDVTLKRPFAQLNLGSYAEDIEAASKAGVVVNQTKVKVTNVYKTFNAFENSVVGNAGEVTFDLNGLLSEKLYADVDANGQNEEFTYLALNYLLVGGFGSAKATTDVTFVWETADGKTNTPETEFKNVPVQTNYRTNIVGWLLTNPAKFNITIDETFQTPDHFVVCSTEELTRVLTPDTNGEITLDNDYDVTGEEWTALDFGSKTVTINGNGHAIKGLDKALVRLGNAADITIEDMTIVDADISYLASDGNETALAVGGFISYMDVSGKVTLRNCHIKNSKITGKERAAGLVGYVSGNSTNSQIIIENCSVEGCEITAVGGTGGMIAYMTAATTIKDSKVENTRIESTEDRTGSTAIAGGVIGTVGGPTTFTNVTVSGNTVINHNANAQDDLVARITNSASLTVN